MKVIAKFDLLDSTNRYANEELDFSKTKEFDVVWALEQYAGKGQQNNQWKSEPNKNLLFSILLYPSFLHPSRQFILTQVLSLSVSDYLKLALPNENIKIKWPNDVCVNGKKICGMLIHNKIIGERFYVAVAGIGININQEKFSNDTSNAISLKMLTNKELDLETELKKVSRCIENRYNKLKENEIDIYQQEYLVNLLNYKQQAQYLYDGRQIEAIIQDVNEFGCLELFTVNKEKIVCNMKEIQYLKLN